MSTKSPNGTPKSSGKNGRRQPALSLHVCQIKYTPQPKRWAYPAEMRRKAMQVYVDGMSLRRIARHLGLHHRTVSLWVKAQAAQLPDLSTPAEVKEDEMDELFTFIGDKKPNRRDHHRRSGHTLLSGLSSGPVKDRGSHSGDGG